MANNFDRFLPDWQLGTLTLTAGSAAFTATDAMLTLGAIRGGDTIFTPSGLTLVIESITDDNNGELSSPCPPAAAGTFTTRIRFQSDNSRYTGQVAALIHQLSGGNVSALGKLILEEGDYLRANGSGVIGRVQGKNLDALTELVGAAGKIISFTDADTMVLLDAPPADTHGNLAQLAALAKANDQFVIMGANGTITLMSINGLIDPIKLSLGTKSSYNWVVNGNFTINQRGGAKKPANGVYGYDRWRGHPNGIEQVIENVPAGVYTFTWSGGGNGTIGGISEASPIKVNHTGGDIYLTVPSTATKVSFVLGDATKEDPWSYTERSFAQEEELAKRYYQTISSVVLRGYSTSASFFGYSIHLPVKMRVSPTSTYNFTASGGTWGDNALSASSSLFEIYALLQTAAGSNNRCYFNNIKLDAEIYT